MGERATDRLFLEGSGLAGFLFHTPHMQALTFGQAFLLGILVGHES
jgi:hypothetical protein